jgi:hypothetical protein
VNSTSGGVLKHKKVSIILMNFKIAQHQDEWKTIIITTHEKQDFTDDIHGAIVEPSTIQIGMT